MSTDDQPTCGKGIAENSILPATSGKLLAAMAETLAVHMQALDLTDANSREEHEAYEKLVREIRQIASQLEATARHMAGYRDLAMGRHDPQAMTHPRVRQTFETFVRQKQELLTLLEQTAESDRALLEMMREHAR
jgi:hypothetical protein